MAAVAESCVAPEALPEPDQLVRVRARSWLAEGVVPAARPSEQPLVRRHVPPERSLSRELVEQRRGARANSLLFGGLLGVALLAFAPAVMAQPSAEERALAGLDRETGIWYPPDAPRQAYVDRSDPEHGFGKDMTEAFKKDPQLRRAVCALVQGEEFEGVERRLSGGLRQFRTMQAMACVSSVMSERREERRRNEPLEWKARWRREMEVERARALASDVRKRDLDEAYAAAWTTETSDERLALALKALGRGPTYPGVMKRVLDMAPHFERPRAVFHEFLRGVLVEEAGEGRPESIAYRVALRNYRLYTGDDAEARAMTRKLIELVPSRELRSDEVLLAMLDRLAGDPAPLERLFAECPTPSGWSPDTDALTTRESFCRDVAWFFADSVSHRLGSRTPAGYEGIVTDLIRAEPTNWPTRVSLIQVLERFAPDAARRECNALLAIPATIAPLGARLDALGTLAGLDEASGETAKARASVDRVLDLLRYRPRKPPVDRWERLLKLPVEEYPLRRERGGGISLVSWALGSKVRLALMENDVARARRGVDEYLGATLGRLAEIERGAKPLEGVAGGAAPGSDEERAFLEWLQQLRGETTRDARHEVAAGRGLLARIADHEAKSGNTRAALRIYRFLLRYPAPEPERRSHEVREGDLSKALDGRGETPPPREPAPSRPWD